MGFQKWGVFSGAGGRFLDIRPPMTDGRTRTPGGIQICRKYRIDTAKETERQVCGVSHPLAIAISPPRAPREANKSQTKVGQSMFMNSFISLIPQGGSLITEDSFIRLLGFLCWNQFHKLTINAQSGVKLVTGNHRTVPGIGRTDWVG